MLVERGTKMADVLWIDIGKGTSERTPLDRELELTGGRHLINVFLDKYAKPGSDPLGQDNILVLSCGPLAGQGVSSAGRLSIGALSPLTGGAKESNAGGLAADALARQGLRAVVIGGLPTDDAWRILIVEDGDVRFEPANGMIGCGNYETAEKLRERFGDSYVLITLGQGGEQLLTAAGIAVADGQGRPSRMAARGGLGAVMGSRRIKAILVRKTQDGINRDNEEFRQAVLNFNKFVAESDRVKTLAQYGTASTVMLTNSLGGLPTRNFSTGVFEGAEDISGENLLDLIRQRGKPSQNHHRCMETCVIGCSNVLADQNGREIVSPLEYETLCLMGSNLGLKDIDEIAKLNYICNDLGVDTIDIGVAMGILAEEGRLRFGEMADFHQALMKVGAGTDLGRIIGMGAAFTGAKIEARRIPVAKGQAFSAYDPRAVKGTGVTYATSPMGGDHTAGLTVFVPVDHHSKKGQLELSRNIQIQRAGYDSLGLCAFLLGATGSRPDLVTDMLNALYKTGLEPSYLDRLGRETIRLELKINQAAGIGPDANKLPDFFRQESLGDDRLTWDFDPQELIDFWQDI